MTSLTLTVPDALAEDLKAAADACEMPLEQFLKSLLERGAAEAAEALGWNEDIEADLAAFAEYEQTGEAIPAEEVFAYLKSLHTGDPLPPPKARKLD
jgi:predicted transcriptional regulator